jgi:hypothetical protein
MNEIPEGENPAAPAIAQPASAKIPAQSRPALPGTGFWVFLSIMVALLLAYLASLRFVERSIEKGKDSVDKLVDAAKETVVEIVDRFQPERVVETFHEWRDLAVETGSGSRLEIATAEASERFARSSDYRIWGKSLPQTKNVSEIVVPATYRFHIELDGDWEMAHEGRRLVVRAPPIRPTLPVAFDTAKVEKRTTAGWARWDASKDLEDLERGITDGLAERATKPETLAKVEDAGRLAVARFVRDWLIDRNAWGEGAFEEIVVVFDGSTADAEIVPAALRLGPISAVAP